MFPKISFDPCPTSLFEPANVIETIINNICNRMILIMSFNLQYLRPSRLWNCKQEGPVLR